MKKIEFSTQKERLAHPQARLIPDSVWEERGLFNEGIDPLLLSLMQTSDEELVSRFGELSAFSNQRDKESAWIALVLSHPGLSYERVESLTKQLNLYPEEIVLTCIWGNLSYFESIYSRYNPKEENMTNVFFFGAALYGHVNIMHHLETKVTKAELKKIIRADDDALLRRAALYNYLEVLRYIEKKVSKKEFQEMIQVKDYEALSNAASHGHLEVLKYLEPKVSTQIVLKMVKTDDYEAFFKVAQGGHIEILRYLESIASKKALGKMIKAGNYQAFRYAADHDQRASLKYLESKVSEETLQKMIQSNNYHAFRLAAGRGNLVVLQYLESKVSEETLQKMIKAEDYHAFYYAAECGHIESLNYIESKVTEDVLQIMIQERVYGAFLVAANYGSLGSLQYLVSKVSKDVLQMMLQARKYSAFHVTHTEVTSYLLQFNSVLGYAEAHDSEYASKKVRPHIDGLLEALRTQKREFENTHPQAVFDVSGEEAKRYFYCIRNLIRRGTLIPRDQLILLLDIPAVKAIVHTGSNPNESNELLRLALNTQNREVVELLLAIPAVVRELAVANNYYRGEITHDHFNALITEDKSPLLMLQDSPALVKEQKCLSPEKLKLSSSLDQFLRLLDGLKKKQEYYLTHHQRAYEQAQKIINALESKANVFYGNPHPNRVIDFKQECVDILNQNASVLREHRALFGSFFTAIHQFFIALQAFLLNEPTRHRFFDNRTNGARVVDALVEDINRFSIEVY